MDSSLKMLSDGAGTRSGTTTVEEADHVDVETGASAGSED
jgi:hypothetical protein